MSEIVENIPINEQSMLNFVSQKLTILEMLKKTFR